ncbi:endonuclease/exonuclease/phosphatase family protein [Pseudonocardia endophytica]|uniref:Endonuclease/exonuclease/phosphatase (EEP) superfamily protein YafD n=1 Tax=Pseudonocardia endophytica TaxID=401976 RepID=A0A4R1IA15_PSEEN|nr:endonuclease/exonuclease/phosphatase family protein [Pseudonocardia endophytica]TCK27152.1 endonuclease/exonuclease/phosphatase (EEP) superfamily protein YafD [Pseudonocardia endophytica]
MSAPPRPDADARQNHPARRRGGPLRWLAALLLTALAAIAVVPDLLFGMDRFAPFVQLNAFRPMALAALVVVVVVFALVTVFRRRVWPITAGLALVAVAGASMVLPRAVADPPTAVGAPLTVLSLNVYEGNADVDSLAALIRSEQPDVVAIPESGQRFRSELDPLIAPLGYRSEASTASNRPDVGGVTLAWSDRLGDLRIRVGQSRPFPYIEATGGGLGDLRFAAYHSVAPTRGATDEWRDDLELLRQWCSGPTPAVVAGDFNATLDHSVLRDATAGCDDAASRTGEGLTGTWPNWAPRWLGPQIDHVFSTNGTDAESFRVIDVPGTDHRAILTTLRRP